MHNKNYFMPRQSLCLRLGCGLASWLESRAQTSLPAPPSSSRALQVAGEALAHRPWYVRLRRLSLWSPSVLISFLRFLLCAYHFPSPTARPESSDSVSSVSENFPSCFLIEQKSGIQHIIYFLSRRHCKRCCSVAESSLTLCDPVDMEHARPPCPSLSPGVCENSCPLNQWCHPSNHLILCCPLVLLPSICPSLGVFSSESALCIRWPKSWSFSFSIGASSEYSGSISFRIDCFHPLAAQGTLKTLLQHHSSKASVLWHSAFFIVQLSHPYLTAGKTISLTMQTLLAVMCLLFNATCGFVKSWICLMYRLSLKVLKYTQWETETLACPNTFEYFIIWQII